MNEVLFSSPTKWQRLEEDVKQITQLVLEFFKKDNMLVEVNLVHNVIMRALNKKWRSKDLPTNVLSFSKVDDWPGDNYLGEIFLAPEYIENKQENFDYLLIHGLLHILGFDHVRKGDRIKMEFREKELLFFLSKWHKIYLPV